MDSMMICLYKRLRKEEWHNLKEAEKARHLLSTISAKSIKKIERAIYNSRRLYIWFVKESKAAKRMDLEFQSKEQATEALSIYRCPREGSLRSAE